MNSIWKYWAHIGLKWREVSENWWTYKTYLPVLFALVAIDFISPRVGLVSIDVEFVKSKYIDIGRLG